jgi:hypothetical protein
LALPDPSPEPVKRGFVAGVVRWVAEWVAGADVALFRALFVAALFVVFPGVLITPLSTSPSVVAAAATARAASTTARRSPGEPLTRRCGRGTFGARGDTTGVGSVWAKVG